MLCWYWKKNKTATFFIQPVKYRQLIIFMIVNVFLVIVVI